MNIDERWQHFGNVWEEATDPLEKWKATLELAKTKPQFFIGDLSTAHLAAIRDTIRVVTVSKVFGSPTKITVKVSPWQYVVSIEGEQLNPSINQLFNWADHILLIDAFEEALRRYHDGELTDYNLHQLFYGPTAPSFMTALSPVYLASFFMMGIGTEQGFWHQEYRNGQPLKSLQCSVLVGKSVFVTAGILSPNSFIGLPYSKATVLDTLEPDLGENIELIWSDTDTIFDPSFDGLKRVLDIDSKSS